jgi:hypothetical protein
MAGFLSPRTGVGRGVEGFFNRLGCSRKFAKRSPYLAHTGDVPLRVVA